MKKVLVSLLAAVMVFGVTACSPNGQQTNGGKTVIKVFSNLPDRTTGQGLVEQKIFDQYVAENQNIEIQVEALDDEAYKIKMKAYASGTSLPDLISVWGQPSFLDGYIDAGLIAELNPDDYSGYGFVEGSLAGFSKDGKLYGLPRNTDMIAFYYNQKLFNDNNWLVPATYDELLALAPKIAATGISPVAMDGNDKWPISIFITDLLVKIAGTSYQAETLKAISSGDFSNPAYAEAARLLQDAFDAGLFQPGFEQQDYGTAQNLFINGQAAMFYMGSWEMSMANNQEIAPEIRDNIRAFTMPVVSGGVGVSTDIAAWNGGGHSVIAKSPVKDEAVKLLNYIYKPENWTKIAWENNVCMSAQDFSQYKTGSETPVQLQLIDIFSRATSISGTTINDLGSSDFKTKFEDLSQQISIKSITPEDAVSALAN
ncbi:MAG: extracellular solute-binding protein [Oscillospiraceae bacterium]|jgi:raffinose/stachyose/melibiose transport system substrate-binding protein|nr:extracellular solute-binding protein [Oscillospiraceae bacterium]